MSALPTKADIDIAVQNVCLVPIADIGILRRSTVRALFDGGLNGQSSSKSSQELAGRIGTALRFVPRLVPRNAQLCYFPPI